MSTYLARLFGLDGTVAVVIGGSSPVGGAVAEGLAQAGATIVVAGRNESRGHRRVERIRALGGAAGFLPVDVTSDQSTRKLLDRSVDEHGLVDSLVECTGVPGAMRRVGETAAAAMQRQPSGLAVLSVVCRRDPGPADCRPALDETRWLACRYAPRRIRFNLLCAGPLAEDPLPGAALPGQVPPLAPPAQLGPLGPLGPLGRPGQPRDLVGAALVLLSASAGGWITGTACYVDGGWSAAAALGFESDS